MTAPITPIIIAATDWPHTVGFIAVLALLAFIYAVSETGRYPWERK